MGIHEVTFEQFWKYVGATQSERLVNPPGKEYLNFPVIKVGWPGAQQFVSWLNENKPKSDNGTYRLPTEAEWEYAARAGSTDTFSWGKSMKKGMQTATTLLSAAQNGRIAKHLLGVSPPTHSGCMICRAIINNGIAVSARMFISDNPDSSSLLRISFSASSPFMIGNYIHQHQIECSLL